MSQMSSCYKNISAEVAADIFNYLQISAPMRERLIEESGPMIPCVPGKDLREYMAEIRILNVLEKFMEKYPEVPILEILKNGTDPNQCSALSLALMEGNLELVELLIKDQPQFDFALDVYGKVLKEAVRRDKLDLVRLLLQKGSNLDRVTTCNVNYPGLIANALKTRDQALIKLLIDSGIDRQVSLYESAQIGNVAAVELLLEKYNYPQDKIEDALYVAAVRSYMGVVRLLLEKTGYVPLSAMAGNAEITRLLLEAGANPDYREDHEEWTPLIKAALDGDEVRVRMLLERGAKLELTDSRKRTALSYGIRSEEVTRLLLEAGANPNVKDVYGQTPLSQAVYANNVEVVKLLLKDTRIKLNYAPRDEDEPLVVAIRKGYDEIAELLLKDERIDPIMKAYRAAEKRGAQHLMDLFISNPDFVMTEEEEEEDEDEE